ncbi:phosphoinositide phospholipase c [Plakobranchus ocellatus]|uniref:Phosphoinositide phospholipase c n=1 Tax=Plakobranchus ocellatus TaxID=259542 RepID=A0AAV3Z8C9_9GAST|nr:phosphoinositide phospholipase c [Plakobranchus ocellatus]
MSLNTAMFEQNARSGYVLKPPVMWDKNHVMYNHFNPWEKEFDGLHTTILTLQVISGQYVCQHYSTNVQVEVEIIGIPVDCAKQKTKVIPKNSLNPIWNDIFTFQVLFADLAFIRFVVIDASTSHMVTQRVIPLKCLRPGYRHVRLRNGSGQPQELSTLFVYTKHEEEIFETRNGTDVTGLTVSSFKRMSIFSKVRELSEASKQDSRELLVTTGTKLKRRMFFISVFGVTAPDEYIILKVTQDSTVTDTIAQALTKVGRLDEKVADYVLVEDVQSGWEKKDQEKASSQRILDVGEKVLAAQNKWKGAGKFILRKLSDDPSSRAWMTTMLKEQKAMKKAHRANLEDPRDFVLVEEFNSQPDALQANSSKKSGNDRMESSRILADDENVYAAQNDWKVTGRFVLLSRTEVTLEEEEKKRFLKGTISKGSNFSKRFGSKRMSRHPTQADKLLTYTPPETFHRSISFPSQVNNSAVVAKVTAPSSPLMASVPQERAGPFRISKKISKLSFKINK